ncbi:MAG TPA: (deoxy)nucleoside triphosphate pyrophosphohydrolase [Euryarchaeota archaeon]|nr:MAG: hypothetical protein DRN57_02300 [Thermoplasmata archaeon]HHD16007.1 (deoxy)nucleoside triphosphate pyrophosphohydrolase [Euryarchaeota archaeon]
MEEYPVLVAAAIIVSGGKVLVSRKHEDSRFGPGKWEFPGGKVDFGEHPEASVRRELNEELGIDVETGPLYEILSHVYEIGGEKRHVVILFYLCRIVDGTPSSLESQEFAWVDRTELGSLSFVEGDLPIVDMLQNDSGVWSIRGQDRKI